jgi:hypothetical protein
MPSSGMIIRVALVRTDVSGERHHTKSYNSPRPAAGIVLHFLLFNWTQRPRTPSKAAMLFFYVLQNSSGYGERLEAAVGRVANNSHQYYGVGPRTVELYHYGMRGV